MDSLNMKTFEMPRYLPFYHSTLAPHFPAPATIHWFSDLPTVQYTNCVTHRHATSSPSLLVNQILCLISTNPHFASFHPFYLKLSIPTIFHHYPLGRYQRRK
ncbi:hypothetical protein RF11_10388 [Thelohanellus kitauei]|uniref:Uncharacterized protein n=1 Tax=Thelohanellus kitauei TaxID=669202 RepID=A0A0C2MZB0_THEKT|nr:hypothetical protein RF11_10388 [Thelohanellus kitauei]